MLQKVYKNENKNVNNDAIEEFATNRTNCNTVNNRSRLKQTSGRGDFVGLPQAINRHNVRSYLDKRVIVE